MSDIKLPQPACYRLTEEDGDWQFNASDSFSGGRSGGDALFTADQMRAAVLADRAARAQQEDWLTLICKHSAFNAGQPDSVPEELPEIVSALRARAETVSDPKSLDAIRAGMVKDGWEIMPDGKMKPPKGYTAIAQTGSTSDQDNRPPTTDVMPDWLTISKPAQVSNIRFRAGTKVRLIVEAAQRYWEYKNEPSREAERIKEAGKRVAALVGVVNGPGHLAQWRHVIDQLPMDGTAPTQERGADDE